MFTARPLAAVAVASVLALATSAPALAHSDQGSTRTSRCSRVNLVSDVQRMAPVTDRHLVNAWGLSQGPMFPRRHRAEVTVVSRSRGELTRGPDIGHPIPLCGRNYLVRIELTGWWRRARRAARPR